MVTITVNVYGATAPLASTVTIAQTDAVGSYYETFTRQGSFSEPRSLPPGGYTITVAGANGENGFTEIEITCTSCTGGPHPKGPQKWTTDDYTQPFILKTV